MGPARYPAIASELALRPEEVEEALATLETQGRVARLQEAIEGEEGEAVQYRADSYLIGFDAEQGWEGAVFDHFQAMVTAVGAKLALGPRASREDRVGGSTYRFDLWPGHPLTDEVMGLLREVRMRASELRTRVESIPSPQGIDRSVRTTFYVGQVIPLDDLVD